MTIEQSIHNIAALNKHDAEKLADVIIDRIIAVLRRDRTLLARSALAWALILADARRFAAERIYTCIHDHVDRADVLNELRDHDLFDVGCDQ